jgi:hypothetical protein
MACSSLIEFARQGVERLLMIELKSYAEMDLTDFVHFHCDRHNSITEARDKRGKLGICLLDRTAMRALGEKHEPEGARTDDSQTSYSFHGYARRILSARDRQELVGDALTGACAMRPFGKQIRDQVWVGEDVSLSSSARFIGPTYIGSRTIVRAGATIGPFTSVERDCVVDCGTTVERSTVLPETYLAAGLLVRNVMVDGRYLKDLDRDVVADLQPAGLGSRMQKRESHLRAFRDNLTDIFSRGNATSAWAFASSPSVSNQWHQVQL